MTVGAVIKATVLHPGTKLRKALLDLCCIQMIKAKGLESGGVDQLAAARQMVQAGAGGCVFACTPGLRMFLRMRLCLRYQDIEQGGLSHPALPHPQAHVSVQQWP